ncbi:MAG: hypothetical protein K6T88_11410 [Bacillus sp. (in: Bacteria)]|nr:hypothetical protein [Bacillus sp. (in: firmicutes)]
MSRANKQYPNDLKLKAVQVYLAREALLNKTNEALFLLLSLILGVSILNLTT